MKRHLPKLLLALPFLVAMAPAFADAPRIVNVTVSRYAFSPARIEVAAGERVRFSVVSTDGAHGFMVKELGLDASIPPDGTPLAIDALPKEPGTFDILCSRYCGRGHTRMRARLVVTP